MGKLEAQRYFLDQDESSHWYLLPWEMKDQWYDPKWDNIDDDYDAQDEFEDLFGQYRTGGGNNFHFLDPVAY